MYKSRAVKIDKNQPELIHFLHKIGASVQRLQAIGDGCPDLLVGFGGRNFLVEVKDGSKPPSARLLTKDQGAWRAAWSGQYAVVESKEDCLSVLGLSIAPESFELSGESGSAWTLEQIEAAAEKLTAAAREVC
jgi:hypothetical protein